MKAYAIALLIATTTVASAQELDTCNWIKQCTWENAANELGLSSQAYALALSEVIVYPALARENAVRGMLRVLVVDDRNGLHTYLKSYSGLQTNKQTQEWQLSMLYPIMLTEVEKGINAVHHKSERQSEQAFCYELEVEFVLNGEEDSRHTKESPVRIIGEPVMIQEWKSH